MFFHQVYAGDVTITTTSPSRAYPTGVVYQAPDRRPRNRSRRRLRAIGPPEPRPSDHRMAGVAAAMTARITLNWGVSVNALV